MRTSVLVPTLNAASYLPALVESLRGQHEAPVEIVIVDSSSADGTAELARELGCDVEEIPKTSFNHGATRNLAAARSRGDVLVFMTQDALPVDATFLGRLVRPIREGEAVATYARQVPYPTANPTEVFARQFNYPAASFSRSRTDVEALGIRAYFFSNVASAIRRDVFEAVGRFPATTIANEDMLLSAKLLHAGHGTRYVADACVYHSHDYDMRQQFRRFFDIGVAMERAQDLLRGGTVGGQGLHYVWEQTRFLAAHKQWKWLARSYAEAGVKFCAMSLGRKERFLPTRLKTKLSMHSFFWSHDGANHVENRRD